MEIIPKNFTLTSASRGFVKNYFKASRLHHLSSWKADLIDYVAKYTQSSQKPSKVTEPYRVIMHVDMDCFFASVGIRDRPQLQGKPVAVAHSTGGINLENSSSEIASCNYEARARGIKNGTFIGSIKKLAPDLVIIPYEFEKYDECSKIVYQILLKEADFVQAVSCDEAYIDVTARLKAQLVEEGFLAKNTSSGKQKKPTDAFDIINANQTAGFGEEEEEDQRIQNRLSELAISLAERIRKDIFQQTKGCTASVGISYNMLLARLATQRAKPNGAYYLASKDIYTLLNPLPIQQLPGFGSSIVEKCQQSSFSITTCQEVRTVPFFRLQQALGEKTAHCLLQYSQGIDPRVLENKPRQSIGSDINWGIRFSTADQLTIFLQEFTEEVFERLQTHDYRAGHLTVSMKKKLYEGEPGKFLGCGHCQDYSKSIVCVPPVDQLDQLYALVTQLVQEINLSISDIRGIGIHLKKLQRKSLAAQETTSSWKSSNSTSSVSGSQTSLLAMMKRAVTSAEETAVREVQEEAAGPEGKAISSLEEESEDDPSLVEQKQKTIAQYYSKASFLSSSSVNDGTRQRGDATPTETQREAALSAVICLCEEEEEPVVGSIVLEESSSSRDSSGLLSSLNNNDSKKKRSTGHNDLLSQPVKKRKKTGGGETAGVTLMDYFSRKTLSAGDREEEGEGERDKAGRRQQLLSRGVDVDFFFSLPEDIQEEQWRLLQMPD